jgi:hypothetical protein
MKMDRSVLEIILTFTLVASAASTCAPSTFQYLTLPNIDIGFLDVAVNTGSTQFCQITIQYTHPGQNDTINTYIGLPLNASSWNNRFQMVGGGGWTAGGLSTIYTPVAAGYTSSSTDAGHTEAETTADWGLVSPGNTNWPALWDFAGVALDEAATLGKLATQLYYGSPPKFSYWNGCSTGGRQGHMMAQRYPDQFDGILAGAPAINWEKFIVQEFWPILMANTLSKCVSFGRPNLTRLTEMPRYNTPAVRD